VSSTVGGWYGPVLQDGMLRAARGMLDANVGNFFVATNQVRALFGNVQCIQLFVSLKNVETPLCVGSACIRRFLEFE
jgi:hypothetical protein